MKQLKAHQATEDKCHGKCKNQASCADGYCICTPGFQGDFCAEKVESAMGQKSSFHWLVDIMLVALLAALAYGIWSLSSKPRVNADAIS